MNVLLLLLVVVVLLAGIVLGSDRYSNIGLGSSDGTEPRAVQSDATAGNVVTTETGRLSSRTAESGAIVVVVIRRGGRQRRCRVDVTVRVQPKTSASASPESVSTSTVAGTGRTTGGRREVSC